MWSIVFTALHIFRFNWVYICINTIQTLRVYNFAKALTCMIFSCINKTFFYQGDGAFGHIVIWTIFTSHIDHFTPQHTDYEQSAASLSEFLELLSGLIPFTILWQAGWILEKTICMNINYNYLTTILRSIIDPNICFSGIIYNFSFWPWKVHKQKL